MIKKQMKEVRGITLIALVVTIVVLLILAGTSIAMLTGDNGIITQAQKAELNTRGGEVKERVFLVASENETIDFSTGTEWKTKADLVAILEAEKKLTEAEADELLGRNGKTEKDDITIGDIWVDFSILNRDDEVTEEITGTVTISEPVWENGTATVTLSTDSGYDIEYKNGETWTKGTTVTGLKHDDTVYARLTNGSSYTEPQQLHIEDTIAPTVELLVEQTTNYGELKVTVTATDAESGLPENPLYKYYIKYSWDEEYPTEATYEGSEATYLFTDLATNENMYHTYDIKVTITDAANQEGEGEALIVSPRVKACFVAGTKISTKDGLRNIEDLKVGDKVYTYNETTKQIEEQDVLTTFIHEVKEIVTITFENQEQIQNTKEHPYYVVGKGWTETKDLKVGDEILTQDNIKIKIANIETNKTENLKVYNITTAINHNYFVGITKFLVHNKG